MRPDENGLPTLGSSASTLGVRLNKDIFLKDDGLVHPRTEGMSVAPDRPENIFQPLRPKELGGGGRNPAYGIDVGDLGPSLTFRRDPRKPTSHGFIEPAYPMEFEEYESSILSTAAAWRRVT
jgi:hypothetical protein